MCSDSVFIYIDNKFLMKWVYVPGQDSICTMGSQVPSACQVLPQATLCLKEYSLAGYLD